MNVLNVLNTMLDEILRNTEEICRHTSGTFWHVGFREILFDSMTFLASLAALMALVSILIEYRKIRKNKDCQKQVLEEIMRYMYGNDVIIEIIRLKMEEREWKDCYLYEAVLKRFTFMEIDMSLTNYAVTSKNYNMLHEFQLFLRNYNIMAEVTAEHFNDKDLDKRIKINDLYDLQDRSRRVFNRIEKLKELLDIDVDPLPDVITEKYRGYFNNIVLELSDEEKKYTERIKIPSQYEAAGLSNHYRKAVYDRAHIFYDIEVFPLKDDAPLYDPFTIDVRKKYDRE